jgi:hypothetical protein
MMEVTYNDKHTTYISTVFYRVSCAYKYSAHLNFTMVFAKNKYFYFSRIVSKEIIIASLFIIKAILNPFSATFDVKCAWNISASFSRLKSVHYTQLNMVSPCIMLKSKMSQETNTLAYLAQLSVMKTKKDL